MKQNTVITGTQLDVTKVCLALNLTDAQVMTQTLLAGQLVDAVIMPVAPHAAVIPGKYYFTGKNFPP